MAGKPFKMEGWSPFTKLTDPKKKVNIPKDSEETSLGKLREADANIRKNIKNLDMSKLTSEQKKMLESYMRSGR